VSVKYKIKNIKTDCIEVFLATINQRSANTISSRNFRLTATRLYKVWLAGSLVRPFKKIRIVMNEIMEKEKDSIAISRKQTIVLIFITNK
jgi:hypothetical protein